MRRTSTSSSMLSKQAHAEHPDMLLMIAGEGPALAHLRNHVHAAHLEEFVRFIGYLDREAELPDCYAAADAFVFASRTETQGLVLLEAMASRIAGDRPCRDGNSRHTQTSFRRARAARRRDRFCPCNVPCRASPELRRNMSQQGRDWANKWSDHRTHPETCRTLSQPPPGG